jgi:hypothetical protein
VASSGGYRRGFEIGGRHYSHIIDPRTGQPTGHVLGATVVAPNAVDAGALATAFCVLTPAAARTLAATVPGVEYMMVLASGERIESAGWHRLEQPRPSAPLISSPVRTLFAAEQSPWTAGWELTVALELARVTGFGAKRPYVAVWIEDKDRFPVRTLAVWYDKARFLPELRAWNRADRLRSMAEGTQILNTVSSATRAPGKYTFTWDGKDTAGALVKSGTYTVVLEVTREHGSYQTMRQDIDVSGTAKHVDLAVNQEVAAASIDYHKANGR